MNVNNGVSSATSSDAIEAKMQKVQASLRQERDKAHREYELATERLHLLRAEVESVEKALEDRQKLLSSIVETTQRLQEKMTIEETVARLTKEVRDPPQCTMPHCVIVFVNTGLLIFSRTCRIALFLFQQVSFQHAEIVTKREKIKQMRDSIQAEAQVRQKKIRDTSKLVVDRRGKIAKREAMVLDITPKYALQNAVEDDVIRDRFAEKWALLVQKKEALYLNETTRMQQQLLPALERVLQQYAKQFGASPTDESTADEANP